MPEHDDGGFKPEPPLNIAPLQEPKRLHDFTEDELREELRWRSEVKARAKTETEIEVRIAAALKAAGPGGKVDLRSLVGDDDPDVFAHTVELMAEMKQIDIERDRHHATLWTLGRPRSPMDGREGE